MFEDGDTQGLNFLISLKNNKILKQVLRLKNKTNQTPLHIACKFGYKEMALLLIDLHKNLGIGLDKKDELGRTPLNLLCSEGNYNFNFDVFNNIKSKRFLEGKKNFINILKEKNEIL